MACRSLVFAMAFFAFDETRLLAWQDQVGPPAFKVNFDAVQQPWSLKGRLLSPSGRPLAKAQIGWPSRKHTMTDKNGNFTLSVPVSAVAVNNDGGDFAGHLLVSAPGNLHQNFDRIPITISQLASKDPVDITLVGGIEFHVRAKFKDGRPAPNVYICPVEQHNRANRVGMRVGRRLGGPALTNEAGETMLLIRPGTCDFVLGANNPGSILPTNNYVVKMAQINENFRPMLSLDFVQGEGKTLEIILDRSPTYQVSVVLADGSPVADATVILMDDREQSESSFAPMSSIAKTDRLGRALIQAIGSPSDSAYIICNKNFERGWYQSRFLVRDYHGKRQKVVLNPVDPEG